MRTGDKAGDSRDGKGTGDLTSGGCNKDFDDFHAEYVASFVSGRLNIPYSWIAFSANFSELSFDHS